MTNRHQQLTSWLNNKLATSEFGLNPIAGDASFRRYYRVQQDGQSYIVMDAPPEQENSQPFVALASAFRQHEVLVPDIIAHDLSQGFLLLSDFGDIQYQHVLNAANADELYTKAIQELLKIQGCKDVADWQVPVFDRNFILMELQRFIDWYLSQIRVIKLTASEQALLKNTFEFLADIALEQPQVMVHRDYHSRNLMLLQDKRVGVIDFQDAVWGPVTYDIISLFRDCYIAWPNESVETWVDQYRQAAIDAGILQPCDQQQFQRWFDLLGIQRHLKVVGIFSRLILRDHKSQFSQDIPQALDYLKQVLPKYKELNDFYQFMQQKVL